MDALLHNLIVFVSTKHIQKEKFICSHWGWNQCSLFPKSIAITP